MPVSHPYAPEVDTLVALLRHRATHQPDHAAYTFLEDGEEAARTWTWADLDVRARAVAAHLGARRGARALVVCTEGLDFLAALFGCLYAGVVAVPVHPPDPHRPARTRPRLEHVAGDARATAALTQAELMGALGGLGLELVDVTALDSAAAGDWRDPGLGADDLAYLQYTSGSTTDPRGVRIAHRHLLHQLADFDLGYDHDPQCTMVSWLPATHDLGLVYGRLMPLFIGFPCVFLAPSAFLARPLRWLSALSVHRGTHSPSPNFGFELAIRKTTAEERARLDLSSVRVLLNGAEPIRTDTERRFATALEGSGLDPVALTHAMGMSEATAKIVSEPPGRRPRFAHLDPAAYARDEARLVPPDTPGALVIASCGAPTVHTEVAVVDPTTRALLAEHRVGELWVRGETVADGYEGRPEATERTFRAHTTDGSGPWLRTGDLAFAHDGEIYLCGRCTDLIILRGQNHHPQDLEWAAAGCHTALRQGCAAAFGVPDPDEGEALALVAEVAPERLGDAAAVFAKLRAALSDADVAPAVLALLPPRALPKTSSGKLRRQHARHLLLNGTLPTLAVWRRPTAAVPAPTELRSRLLGARPKRRLRLLVAHLKEQAAALLGVAPTDLDADRPVGALGLDSVAAVELLERAGGALSLRIEGTVLFDHPTLRAIAEHLLAELDAATSGATE